MEEYGGAQLRMILFVQSQRLSLAVIPTMGISKGKDMDMVAWAYGAYAM